MFNSGSDPMLQALKSINYLAVRLPKADLHPLHIMSRNSSNLTRLGDITNVFTQGQFGPPPIQRDGTVANINGSRTGSMKIGLGLSILGNIIGAMGGSKLGVDVAYKSATTAVFEFQNVTEDKIGIDLLDRYLGSADINPASVVIGDLLDNDSVFVVTAVLRSDTFVFEAKGSSGVEVKVDVPVIQQAVGGNVTVEKADEAVTKVAYKGKVPLAFGFQAVQLFFQDGNFTAFKPAQNVAMAFTAAAGSSEEGVEYMAPHDNFVSLRG